MTDPRSYLYVPGDRPAFLGKALARSADAIIVDLEDAVALGDKPAARDTVLAWLEDLPQTSTELWVRINPGAERDADLEAFASHPRLTGLCLAKAENADDVATVARRLDVARSSAVLMPLLETAAAVFEAAVIARAPRVQRLQIGEADLAADVGVDPSPHGEEFAWARSRVVFASAAAGISAPVAAVSVNFRDLDLLMESTERMRRMGFFGRACVHPAQVTVANDVFRVAPEAAARAQTLLDRQAELGGRSVFVAADGTMVDEAVLRAARRTAAQARA